MQEYSRVKKESFLAFWQPQPQLCQSKLNSTWKSSCKKRPIFKKPSLIYYNKSSSERRPPVEKGQYLAFPLVYLCSQVHRTVHKPNLLFAKQFWNWESKIFSRSFVRSHGYLPGGVYLTATQKLLEDNVSDRNTRTISKTREKLLEASAKECFKDTPALIT